MPKDARIAVGDLSKRMAAKASTMIPTLAASWLLLGLNRICTQPKGRIETL